MRKKETFIIHIVSQENSTWQGQVTWLNDKRTSSFRSLLELIKLMDEAVAIGENDGGEYRREEVTREEAAEAEVAETETTETEAAEIEAVL
mgnify:CR=1 FL=1